LTLNTDYITLTPADVVAHVSNVSFDPATLEIWGALLNGARLVVIDREVVLSPWALGEAVQRHRITVLVVPTALFNQVAEEAPEIFAGIRHVLFGGEAADPRCVARVLDRGRPGRLLNVYGPTEATTITTWQQVDQVPAGASTIPIGRPIS